MRNVSECLYSLYARLLLVLLTSEESFGIRVAGSIHAGVVIKHHVIRQLVMTVAAGNAHTVGTRQPCQRRQCQRRHRVTRAVAVQ